MAFFLKKTIELAEYGWKDCEISFQALQYDELLELQKKIQSAKSGGTEGTLEDDLVTFLCTKLISGEGLNDKGEKEPITKDNFRKLPLEIVSSLAYKLSGGDISPN